MCVCVCVCGERMGVCARERESERTLYLVGVDVLHGLVRNLFGCPFDSVTLLNLKDSQT
jgi:hypothetical protein